MTLDLRGCLGKTSIVTCFFFKTDQCVERLHAFGELA